MSNLAGSPPSIEFRNVSFAYNGQKAGPEQRELRRGRRPEDALAGSSGSGKTTVLKLLLGMYAPGRRRRPVGSIDVRKLSLSRKSAGPSRYCPKNRGSSPAPIKETSSSARLAQPRRGGQGSETRPRSRVH